MNLVGTGQTLSGNDYARAAKTLDCEEAVIRAVTFVEARGNGFDAKRRPIMLPERHVFYRCLPIAKRDTAVKAGLAYRKWRPGNYPSSQDARYELLEQMMEVDREAGLRACSWGIGQVLGENAALCGFRSAEALVTKCLEGEGGQLDVMIAFIKGAGLAKHLQAKDWAAFAKGYNGPAYAENRYHEKLGRAYARFSRFSPTAYDPLSDGLLSVGDKGGAVATLQRGLGIHADGDFGAITEQAVRAFQKAHGLPADGKVGKVTGAALGLPFWADVPAPAPAPQPSSSPVLEAVPSSTGSDVPEADRRFSIIADLILNLCAALSALFKGTRT